MAEVQDRWISASAPPPKDEWISAPTSDDTGGFEPVQQAAAKPRTLTAEQTDWLETQRGLLWKVPSALEAFQDKFNTSFGKEPIGLKQSDTEWFIKHGIFRPDDKLDGLQSTLQAFSEAIMGPAVGILDAAIRAPGAAFQGLQAAGMAMGLPRDIVALPEAFLGSPHPTGIPKTLPDSPLRVEPAREPTPVTPAEVVQARELGVVGPERPSIDVGTPKEAADRVVQPETPRTIAAEQAGDVVRSEVPKVATDKAGNIRLDLIEVSNDAEAVIRAAAEEGGDFMPARRGEIPLGQVEALSQVTGISAAELDTKGIGRILRNDDMVRTYIQAMIQSSEETATAMKKAALTEAPEDLIEFQRLRMRHAALQEQVSGLTAEWGRTGNVFQEFSDRVKDAKSLGEFLKDKKGETLDDLRDLAKLGSQLDPRTELPKWLNEMRDRKVGWIYNTWVQGLISGLFTHTKYVMANAFYATTEYGVTSPIAALIGNIKRLGGAEAERVFFGEALASTYGMITATPAAVIGTFRSIKAGMRLPLNSEIAVRNAMIARGEKVPASLERSANPVTGLTRPTTDFLGWFKPESMTHKVAARVIGAPGDMASGIHTFFKILGERASLEAQAYRNAASEKLSPTGSEFWERRAELANNPTEKMQAQAIEDGYNGTFMGELGPRGKAFQKFVKDTPGLRWVFPFTHIPVNLVKATYAHTPLAVLDSALREDLIGKNGGIKQDKAIARMVVGASVMGWFFHQAMKGNVTGDYPRDQKERDSWKLVGKQPNSIRIGDYWVSFERFGPAGSLAGIGANMAQVVHHLQSTDDDAMEKATYHAAEAAARIVVNEVGFQSLANIFEAYHDPDKKGARWVANTAATFIPFSSALGQQAAFMDPHMREAKTIVDMLKNRIPAQRETLLPKRDWMGQPVPNAQYHSVVRVRAINPDPVNAEMERLQIHPTPPQDRIGGVKLTPEMFDRYQVVAGAFTKQALEATVSAPGWHELPDYVRETAIRRIISSTRHIAAGAMQAANPELIQQGVKQKTDHILGVTHTSKPKKAPEIAPQ